VAGKTNFEEGLDIVLGETLSAAAAALAASKYGPGSKTGSAGARCRRSAIDHVSNYKFSLLSQQMFHIYLLITQDICQ